MEAYPVRMPEANHSGEHRDTHAVGSPIQPPAPATGDLRSAMALMRERGLRVSAARRLVLEALLAADGPMSAEQIAHGIGGRVPSSDVASVYRNLHALHDIGLVRHVHLGHS